MWVARERSPDGDFQAILYGPVPHRTCTLQLQFHVRLKEVHCVEVYGSRVCVVWALAGSPRRLRRWHQPCLFTLFVLHTFSFTHTHRFRASHHPACKQRVLRGSHAYMRCMSDKNWVPTRSQTRADVGVCSRKARFVRTKLLNRSPGSAQLDTLIALSTREHVPLVPPTVGYPPGLLLWWCMASPQSPRAQNHATRRTRSFVNLQISGVLICSRPINLDLVG